jgi:hypothetical protein
MGRGALAVITLACAGGCATFDYSSSRPASVVSDCIAEGWRRLAMSGYELPVSRTKLEHQYFVGVELSNWYGPLPTGAKHPTYAVWAEVTEAPAGSTTEYRRAYQFTHERTDRVVKECQEAGPGTR